MAVDGGMLLDLDPRMGSSAGITCGESSPMTRSAVYYLHDSVSFEEFMHCAANRAPMIVLWSTPHRHRLHRIQFEGMEPFREEDPSHGNIVGSE